MASVWIIEAGGYSEYRVAAIFSTRENAERALLHFNAGRVVFDLGEVVECALDPLVEEMREGGKAYVVRFNSFGHGQAEECRSVNFDTDVEFYRNGAYVHVFARDADHALKIAADKYAQARAEKDATS